MRYDAGLARPLMPCSPLAFVQQVRMETARHLLSTTRLSVEEIACRVGYDTSATLRRVLAQHTGLRPSDLRPPRAPVAR